MALIEINESALQTCSENLNNKITELQEMNLRLENITNRIEASWEGQSSRAYISIMRNYSIKSNDIIKVLTEYKGYVDSAINKFTTLDNNSASRIRNSF